MVGERGASMEIAQKNVILVNKPEVVNVTARNLHTVVWIVQDNQLNKRNATLNPVQVFKLKYRVKLFFNSGRVKVYSKIYGVPRPGLLKGGAELKGYFCKKNIRDAETFLLQIFENQDLFFKKAIILRSIFSALSCSDIIPWKKTSSSQIRYFRSDNSTPEPRRKRKEIQYKSTMVSSPGIRLDGRRRHTKKLQVHC